MASEISEALLIMGQGMGGLFVVLGIIVLGVIIIKKI
jgi:hypothetical protein